MIKIQKEKFEIKQLKNNSYYIMRKSGNNIFLNQILTKNNTRVCNNCKNKVRLIKIKQDWVCPKCLKRCSPPKPKII